MITQRMIRVAALITGWMAIASLCQCTDPQPTQPDASASQSGYLLDTTTGCKVWDIDPEANDSVMWSGGCDGGFATGFGVLEWHDEKGTFIERDEGTLVRGIQNGVDKASFANGDELITDLKNGVPMGQETYKYANGNVIVGNVIDGQFEGNGIETYANGDKYVGPFSDDNANGQGTETLANGDEYVGEFSGGEFNGQGTETYSSGDKIIGEFSNGLPNGQATYTLTDGEKFVGDFKDGKFIGPGTYTYTNGEKYVGKFQDYKPNGEGTLFSANGTILHSGIWQDGAFVKAEPTFDAAEPSTASKYSRDQEEIPLVSDGGSFKIPVNINGTMTLDFVVDSGSAYVSIPADVVRVMFRTGTLTTSDFLRTINEILADGSTVPSQEFRIRSLKVGDIVLQNVVGSVADENAPLLLGQSFLSRFTSWTENNKKHVLELQN